MGLFTSTQVINDGTADRTFVHRGQVPNPKSFVSEYFEPATIADETKMTAKYEVSNSPAQRNVFSTTALIPDKAGVMKRATINTSVAYDKGCDVADVEGLLDLHEAALDISGARTRFLQRMP